MKYKLLCSCIICHEEKSISGIHTHYIRSHTDKGRDLGKQNGKNSAILSKISSFLKQLEKWKIYYAKPKKCAECAIELTWFQKENKFCCQRCAAISSNNLRPAGDKSRLKGNDSRSKLLTKVKSPRIKKIKIQPMPICVCCGVIFKRKKKRKTCSNICLNLHMSSIAQNRPKHFRPSNRGQIIYNGHVLGSTYELNVCISLDKNNILWKIPNGVKYLDSVGKLHIYYPDLYLPDYDIYLDPKNDYLINNANPYHGYKDIDKIRWAEKYNNIRVLILNKNQLDWEIIKKMVEVVGVEPTRISP